METHNTNCRFGVSQPAASVLPFARKEDARKFALSHQTLVHSGPPQPLYLPVSTQVELDPVLARKCVGKAWPVPVGTTDLLLFNEEDGTLDIEGIETLREEANND